ncbi:hypothetical protein [Paenibacillus radicis (ex Xue et al. 2023)]|uniref:Uncharacterized protein n=1 Tax=Paenibacillus radicis (ex Xue et al. 2023) TaxID=2972489 RepID=A0ABT1YM37_9BACL|nr:hypothetical protein [Paenibacillus radicis (ex Xue et al. 2023)]MCR8633464.1 hypothetical protein [Paenibacillus radicis (ex Xue et al. 2023)]
MRQELRDLRTKGLIFTLGQEKYIIRKATEQELAEHGIAADPNQVTMDIDNNVAVVPAFMGD